MLIAIVAGGSFAYSGIQNIYAIGRYDPNVFGSNAVRVDPLTLARQQMSVYRAGDYLRSVWSLFVLDIMSIIVPIALLCCIDSMCKNSELKYFWFSRFGLAILVMVLIILAQGIATLNLTSRATHAAGVTLLFAAFFAAVSAVSLGANWKMVIQGVIAVLAAGVGLYYVVISPGTQSIMGNNSVAVIP